jgi:hypothetical protein
MSLLGVTYLLTAAPRTGGMRWATDSQLPARPLAGGSRAVARVHLGEVA